MKKHLTLTMAVMVVCGLFASGGKAQTGGPQTIRARIPFTFTVGAKSLPAGVYIVSILNPSSDRKVLQIRSENGRESAIIQTLGVDGTLADNARLVFRRYGDRYFFAQAQMAGDTICLSTAKMSAERATQRALRRYTPNSIVAIIAK